MDPMHWHHFGTLATISNIIIALIAPCSTIESLNSPKKNKQTDTDATKSCWMPAKIPFVINDRHAELPLDEQMPRRWRIKQAIKRRKAYTKDIEGDKPHSIEYNLNKSKLIATPLVDTILQIKFLSTHAKSAHCLHIPWLNFSYRRIVIIWNQFSMIKVMKKQFLSILKRY